MMDNLDLSAPGETSINDTTDECPAQRAVAGTIDTVMDLTSKFIPAMQNLLTGGMRSQVVRLRLILTRKQNGTCLLL